LAYANLCRAAFVEATRPVLNELPGRPRHPAFSQIDTEIHLNIMWPLFGFDVQWNRIVGDSRCRISRQRRLFPGPLGERIAEICSPVKKSREIVVNPPSLPKVAEFPGPRTIRAEEVNA
jgi:hypothetical protein